LEYSGDAGRGIMFENSLLQNHLNSSSTVKSNAFVVAEWNLNLPENIDRVGNYRFRPAQKILGQITKPYSDINTSYDYYDEGNWFTGATDADVVIDGTVTDFNIPTIFKSKKEKESTLYSLEDCVGRFRPRSGINKVKFFENNSFIHHSNSDLATRPRYYMSHKEDRFKYWSSYRQEASDENNDGVLDTNIDRGIANIFIEGQNYIDDAAPFVVYKNPVPANRIVVKMQTNVGTTNLGPFSSENGQIQDPLFGVENQTTPVKWSIQYLENNSWANAIDFDADSVRASGLPIIGPDGYVEISYGLIVPEKYKAIFVPAGSYFSASQLPTIAQNGYAFLVGATKSTPGTYHIWIQETGSYESFVPTYGWSLGEQGAFPTTPYVTEFVDPPTFSLNNFKEFQFISGVRIVVETMNKPYSTFDLIEMSPRLAANVTDRVTSYNVSRPASDLGVSGMPVGQLLASVGSITLFDYDQSFSETNADSIVGRYTNQHTQIKIYDVVTEVEERNQDNLVVGAYDFYVPVKTMYVDGFPVFDSATRMTELELRDLYFLLETITAPSLMMTQVSLSFAIATLLDYLGFSNYVFRRIPEEPEPIIPFFFVPPDMSVAEILQDLAISTQSAMFFDEYNNFVVMSKNYIMPAQSERETNLVLSGSPDSAKVGVVENARTSTQLANLVEVVSKENSVFNNGNISYTTRHIKRSYGSVQQSMLLNRDKTWVYEPAELWEISPEEQVRSINSQSNDQSSYALTAIPLNTDLSDKVPSVVNNRLINNTMDLGEAIYWVVRYNGYFYANGEVIKYDAVQYSIPGLDSNEDEEDSNSVWISSNQEYQKYFSKLPFGGKIYPTGIVRIYSEPNYEVVGGITRFKNGKVAKHGRGQFGTPVINHLAGLNPYWSDPINLRGCNMENEYLFGKTEFLGAPGLANAGKQGVTPDRNATAIANRSQRNGVVKNFLSSGYLTETEVGRLYSTQSGTVQSSALVFNGPNFFSDENAFSHISYVYKQLDNKYRHFGTRLRIVGKYETDQVKGQTPVGLNSYYSVSNSRSNQSTAVSGSSAGLGVMVNPETNVGYYFELAALTENNVDQYTDNNIYDVLFYKIVSDSSNKAIPIRLWADYVGIKVDPGNFVGQSRVADQENQTVYDISVDYEDVGARRRFYLYINNNLVQIVDDINPLPIYNNMSLFVRGSARAMFENVYALTANYGNGSGEELNLPASTIFNMPDANFKNAFRKYAISGVVQSAYISGISSSNPPKHNMYFEEFGTIMREATYIKVRYDKAFPALYARIAPTFNMLKGYVISGFMAGSYDAEFMIFNATDTVLSLDSTSGNYLRIHGITFTQESQNELTVDEYFNKAGSLSDPQFSGNGELVSPLAAQQRYSDIKVSRLQYGNNEFSVSSSYIQSQDDANSLMGWLISKIAKPRLSVGVRIFSNPTIQLGDIVEIDYKDESQKDQVAPRNTRFVVYQIDNSRDSSGPEMTLYLSEVA
jgi:hypothetical protein